EIEIVDRQGNDLLPPLRRETCDLRGQRRLAGALQPGDGIAAGALADHVVEDVGDERGRISSRGMRLHGHRATMGGRRRADDIMAASPAQALTTFDALFDEALAAGEPDRTAMVVATATHDARPSARTVLL